MKVKYKVNMPAALSPGKLLPVPFNVKLLEPQHAIDVDA